MKPLIKAFLKKCILPAVYLVNGGLVMLIINIAYFPVK